MSRAVDIRIALPLLLALAFACYLLFPDYLGLLRTVFIVAIFALSYDLLQGYAGIVSLGHAVFFGLGASPSPCSAARAWPSRCSRWRWRCSSRRWRRACSRPSSWWATTSTGCW
jgi:hypothetical protein